eukprot:7114607-Ditylum_brightwellii.AAC.1
MLPTEIPNLPLPLLGLQGTDVQLKDIVRNHDSRVIAHNQKNIKLALQIDCLAALPHILVKP